MPHWPTLFAYAFSRRRVDETVIARLAFFSPDAHRGRVTVGLKFQVREGQRVVATGVVSKLLS